MPVDSFPCYCPVLGIEDSVVAWGLVPSEAGRRVTALDLSTADIAVAKERIRHELAGNLDVPDHMFEEHAGASDHSERSNGCPGVPSGNKS